ncbi:MAG: type VI secretion system tip protein VgrG [Phycisphaerales bacterium]|nr:type VI secretion system tip protein VgrG [Phycisphaerales bacterium]
MSQIDENRFGAIKIGEDLHLLSFRGSETLGRLFQWEADLIKVNPGVDFNKLIGESASVRLSLREQPKRFFSGIVASIEEAGSHQSLPKYRATIVPWLWFASRSSDCRIFQDVTPIDASKAVLSDYDMGIGGVEDKLTRSSYPTSEYIVQYNESALDFVSRLMEKQGVYFSFRHDDGGKHALHLFDGPESHGSEDIGEIEFRAPGHGDSASLGHIREWRASGHALTGEVALRDWNFTQPQSPLHAKHVASAPHALGDFERFAFPGKFKNEQEGGEYARIVLEAIRAGQTLIHGVADNVKLEPGRTFTFKPDGKLVASSYQGKYLVTSCSYEFNVPGLNSRASGPIAQAEGPLWSVKFTAIPAETPYRTPQTTPKPRVAGPQTAIVTGPSGEELYLDEHGRVKVQFHWDRDGKSDENSSCWLRVAQQWAGKGWGAQFWPRIGQEVIVDFIDGDPDRPIITGRVYNSENKPPYDPRQFATISAIKTSSSKGGEGFNELRFEDKADSEMIWIHAQKRMDFRIRGQFRETNYASREIRIGWEKDGKRGGDHNILVRNNTNRIIENDYYDTLKGERHQTIEKDAFFDLQENRTTKVAETDSLNAKVLIVATEEKISLKTDKFLAEGSGGVDIKSGDDLKLGAAMHLHAKGGMNLNLEGGMNATLKGGMNTVVEGGVGVTIKCGGSFIAIGPAGVDIVGPMVKINSGGAAGSGQAASDPASADDAEDFEITEPLTALIADDGQPGKVSKAGPGGGRSNKKRSVKPKNPPKSKPIPPPVPLPVPGQPGKQPDDPSKVPLAESEKPCGIKELTVVDPEKGDSGPTQRKPGPGNVLQIVASASTVEAFSRSVGEYVKIGGQRKTGGDDEIEIKVIAQDDSSKGKREISVSRSSTPTDWQGKPSLKEKIRPPSNDELWPSKASPDVYYIHGRGCDEMFQTIRVESFPSQQYELTVETERLSKAVSAVTDKISQWVKSIAGDLWSIKTKMLVGKFTGSWGWKEADDWQAFFAGSVTAAFDPFLELSGRVTGDVLQILGQAVAIPPAITSYGPQIFIALEITGGLAIEGTIEKDGPDSYKGSITPKGQVQVLVEMGAKYESWLVSVGIVGGGKAPFEFPIPIEWTSAGVTMKIEAHFKGLTLYYKMYFATGEMQENPTGQKGNEEEFDDDFKAERGSEWVMLDPKKLGGTDEFVLFGDSNKP